MTQNTLGVLQAGTSWDKLFSFLSQFELAVRRESPGTQQKHCHVAESSR